MRRIAIINQKGGVGKTTTTANVAAALSRAGQRVLLFDLDPQAHLSLHLGVDPASGRPGVYELLSGSAPVSKVRVKVGTNLWLVGANLDLAAAEVELVGVLGREVLLRDLLDQRAGAAGDGRSGRYDYVLFDCPPSLGILTLNGLCAAREVVIPLQPHFLALQGLGKLLETVLLVNKRINAALRVTGVVMCMHDAGTKLGAEVAEDVRLFLESARRGNVPWSSARLFETVIRRNIKLAEAPSHGKSIFDYAPESNGARDYERLARELHDPGSVPAAAPAGGVGESDKNPSEAPASAPVPATADEPMAPDPLAGEMARRRDRLARPAAPAGAGAAAADRSAAGAPEAPVSHPV